MYPKHDFRLAVSLTWATLIKYIRARACTTPSDNQQADNDDVRIGLPVSVSLSPTTINPGGNITATYTNRVQEMVMADKDGGQWLLLMSPPSITENVS